MYIVFNNNGVEFLRFNSKNLPDSLKKYKHIWVDKVPKKDDMIEIAKFIDGELVWEYKPIPKLPDEDLKEKVKELQETVDILLGGEEFD